MKLHEQNILVIAPKGSGTRTEELPDLIAYPIGGKKYLWDDSAKKAYEIQTSARPDKIRANARKDIGYGLPIVWVSHSAEVLAKIRELAPNDEYLLI